MSELQSRLQLVCRLLLEKKKTWQPWMRNRLQFLVRSHVMLLSEAIFTLKVSLIQTKQWTKLLVSSSLLPASLDETNKPVFADNLAASDRMIVVKLPPCPSESCAVCGTGFCKSSLASCPVPCRRGFSLI